MEGDERSKLITYTDRIGACADDVEKTRQDYLKDCSNYYDKYLNERLMKKGFWMMEEQDKIALKIRNRELAEDCWKD